MTDARVGPNDMTTAQVAVLLGKSTKTVDRLRKNGVLNCTVLGAKPRVYFDRADVLAYQRRATQDADHG